MLLRKRLFPASLFTLLLLALSQVGFSQTANEITIGILEVYTVDFSPHSVDRVRSALRDELIAFEQPGLRVAIGTDTDPAGGLDTSRDYFHESARVNGYDYYLVSRVIEKVAGIFVDMQLYSTEPEQIIWDHSTWYASTDHLLSDLSPTAGQIVAAINRHAKLQTASHAPDAAQVHNGRSDWDYGLGVLICWPARRDPRREEWASGFGIGIFQETIYPEGLTPLFPNWISPQIGFAMYAGYNQMGFAAEQLSHQFRAHAQLLLPFFLDFTAIGAAYHREWGADSVLTSIAGVTVTFLYLSSTNVWWPLVYELGTVRYLYDFSMERWYVELDLLRIGISLVP